MPRPSPPRLIQTKSRSPRLTILAEVLLESDVEAAQRLLLRLHSKYRDDFWVNHLLAEAFSDRKDPAGDRPS